MKKYGHRTAFAQILKKLGKKRLVSKVSDCSLVTFDCVAVTVLSAINAQSPKKTFEKLINSPLAKTFFALEDSLSIKRFWGKRGREKGP